MKTLIKKCIKTILKFARGVFRLLPLSNKTRAHVKEIISIGVSKLNRQVNPGTIPDGEGSALSKTYEAYINDIFHIGKRSKEFVDYKENHITFSDSDVKPIAFYLPQFHTFLENDEWWGKGFTEWTNVTKAVPQYVGHYQPHLPYDSTFYDLSNVEVMKSQVALARNYGIYGFCFHYYWFSGKRLMETPLENFLKIREGLDFPFCINWANENWSRRWDGSDHEILIAQKHSDEDDLACIADICHYISDERYIKVNGKPLIIIYNASVFPDINRTIEIWRTYCREIGIGDICLAGARTYPTRDPLIYDFDEAVEFPPHFFWESVNNITNKMVHVQKNHNLDIRDIEEYINCKRYFEDSPARIFRGVFPNWDNTARRGDSATIHASNPALYQRWLLDVMQDTKLQRKPQERIVFVNAWNEWAEGAHLEPDRRYGYAYLQATADAIKELRKDSEER